MFVTRATYADLQQRHNDLRRDYAALLDKIQEIIGEVQGIRIQGQAELTRERKLTRYLLKQVLTLRKEGFAPPRTEQQQHVSTPQSDVDLVYNTQRQLARDAAYQDLLAQGLSPDEARGEAARMIDSLFAPVAGEFQ